MANNNDKLVVAYYQNIPTAGGAAQELMEWDEADDDIKLGAIAVMSYDPLNDALKADEVGQRNTRKGALWGTAIGATLGILTGGIALIPGLIIGAGTGAAIGAVDHKDVVITDGEAAEMLERLRHGAGAVAVMADDFEVEPVKIFLARLGGDVDDFTLPAETAEAVTAAAAAQITAAESVEESLAESTGDVELEQRVAAAELGDMDADKATAISSLAALGALSVTDAAKMHDEGIDKASKLLAQGATPQGRAELAEASGVDEDVILVAVKEMDLMRVKGVGVKYAYLLLASGVETVPDLARRNGANLALKLADVNESAEIVEDLPSEETVTDWVAQAKELPRMITY
jgi:uncharacterized membrane protein/predicted flap endonuclease-1-like 5' DNA nuclease